MVSSSGSDQPLVGVSIKNELEDSVEKQIDEAEDDTTPPHKDMIVTALDSTPGGSVDHTKKNQMKK